MKYFVTVFLFALVAGIRSEYFEVLNDGEIPPRHPYFVGYNTVLFISSLMNIFNRSLSLIACFFFSCFSHYSSRRMAVVLVTFYLQSCVKNISRNITGEA